jgi:hypothetical protein
VASDLPFAWLRQAESDFRSGERLVGTENPCQAVAKYQQAVEKSVKAISEAFFDRRIFSSPIRGGHDVDRLVTVILTVRHRRSNRNWGLQFKSLFNDKRRDAIRTVSQLAPQKAAAGQLEGNAGV